MLENDTQPELETRLENILVARGFLTLLAHPPERQEGPLSAFPLRRSLRYILPAISETAYRGLRTEANNERPEGDASASICKSICRQLLHLIVHIVEYIALSLNFDARLQKRHVIVELSTLVNEKLIFRDLRVSILYLSPMLAFWRRYCAEYRLRLGVRNSFLFCSRKCAKLKSP